MKIMAEENVSHQLAAIFYADVSGYSRLTEADELSTHRQLFANLDLIADRIRNSAGDVVHYAGDAVLARFQSVVAATNCAIGIQVADVFVRVEPPSIMILPFKNLNGLRLVEFDR